MTLKIPKVGEYVRSTIDFGTIDDEETISDATEDAYVKTKMVHQ